MAAIWICAFYRVFLSLRAGNFVNRAAHGTLVANGGRFDFLRVLGVVFDL